MDYGDRQDRALRIIERCRARPDMGDVAFINEHGLPYSYARIAYEIEQMTDIGRETVAMAELVDQAVLSRASESA
jgi:hypothetical protein